MGFGRYPHEDSEIQREIDKTPKGSLTSTTILESNKAWGQALQYYIYEWVSCIKKLAVPIKSQDGVRGR
jgi:hypothetical protein